jgi:PAS domain-containing protein
MNPQRPYDQEYQNFIRQLTESLIRATASITIPDDQRRYRSQAEEMALKHAKISSHLMQRTQEAEHAKSTFERLAESAPVGMCLLSPEGKAHWVNQAYLDHLSSNVEDIYYPKFLDTIHPSDHDLIKKTWATLKEGGNLPLVEMRTLKYRSHDRKAADDEDEYKDILAGPSVLLDESGQVESIIGW